MSLKWSPSVLNDPIGSPPFQKTLLKDLFSNTSTDNYANQKQNYQNQNHETDYISRDEFNETSRLNSFDNEDDDDGGYGGGYYNGLWGCNLKLYKGIFYSSLSSLFFSLCSVIVKYLDVSKSHLVNLLLELVLL